MEKGDTLCEYIKCIEKLPLATKHPGSFFAVDSVKHGLKLILFHVKHALICLMERKTRRYMYNHLFGRSYTYYLLTLIGYTEMDLRLFRASVPQSSCHKQLMEK